MFRHLMLPQGRLAVCHIPKPVAGRCQCQDICATGQFSEDYRYDFFWQVQQVVCWCSYHQLTARVETHDDTQPHFSINLISQQSLWQPSIYALVHVATPSSHGLHILTFEFRLTN